MMEHVFFKFHEKQSNYVLRNFSRPTRSIIENTCLIVAVIGFSVVAVSHRTFVYRGNGIHSSTLSLPNTRIVPPSLTYPPPTSVRWSKEESAPAYSEACEGIIV